LFDGEALNVAAKAAWNDESPRGAEFIWRRAGFRWTFGVSTIGALEA
jgi:hypothetical protein